jgi:hypothetical protein
MASIRFHGWFSWLLVSVFDRPSCLMGGRRTTSNSNYRRDISKPKVQGQLKLVEVD